MTDEEYPIISEPLEINGRWFLDIHTGTEVIECVAIPSKNKYYKHKIQCGMSTERVDYMRPELTHYIQKYIKKTGNPEYHRRAREYIFGITA